MRLFTEWRCAILARLGNQAGRGLVWMLAVGVMPAIAQQAGGSKPEVPAAIHSKAAPNALPSIVESNGRYALMVDGAPYLMLGVQANNSSAWPDYLDKVWPAAETLHANTVELPVYWEQVEAVQGKFDFSVVDLILKQAREHKLRLVLLWFGTWKNGSSHYTPEWIKTDQAKYPFLVNKKGETVDSPSTFSPARLEADKTAFGALMRHLKLADAQHTVLMVQVENEAGVWGGVRDYGVEAEKAFAGQVPEKLVKAMGKEPGTWKQVFGEDADETFQGWCIASYIEEVAAAGKREYGLPLYVNAAIRDPFHPGRAPNYESGAPTDNNIVLYKTAAPSLSLLAPDIYEASYAKYMKLMELYKRPDNPLLIPETGNPAIFAHYVYAAIGAGAIGWAPFGLDLSGCSNQTEGSGVMEESALKPFAATYAVLAPIARELALWSYQGKVKGSSEDPENHHQSLPFNRWTVEITYGVPSFGGDVHPKGNTPTDGGVVIAQLGLEEFLIAGHHARVDFTPTAEPGKKRFWMRVEEGSYDARGEWKMTRLWNGDQSDYGLNLTGDQSALLKVRVTTY